MTKKHIRIFELFLLKSNVVNVGGSCKRKDCLREKQAAKIIQELEDEEISSGRGLNQESTLIHPSETRWSSHYGTILRLIHLFDSIIGVIHVIKIDGSLSNQRAEASRLIRDMLSFDFIFDLHLMKKILGITNDLSQALQRKDQDIVNVMNLVNASKTRLQVMRDGGWDELVDCVSSSCNKHKIEVSDMDDVHVGGSGKRSKRKAEEMTNLHRFRMEVFNTVLDMQLLELNDRFNEANMKLLLCVACLNPSHSFKAFDVSKLLRLTRFYQSDFDNVALLRMEDQLKNFVLDMRSNIDTSNMNGIGDLTQRMVESGRYKVYPLVYKLITLALVLPVATTSVEKTFSATSIVKTWVRNCMGDEWMNDNLVVYIENDIFEHVTNEAIIRKFENMANRRGHYK